MTGALGAWLVIGLPVWIASVLAQTPDASLQGIVRDIKGLPLAGANLTAIHSDTGFTQSVQTDWQGEYFLGSLPRGSYALKLEMAGYLGLEKQGIELAVGSRHEENFTLSPISTDGRQTAANELFQTIPPTPSLPVETIASSVSVVVEESKILKLPLASRNVYSLFLLQPGVTSQGAVVSRGLTFSVHGQRVSGSNYLLDGVDNNNIVLTGPVAATSVEVVQEFRMVNSSFSSENGRATAFVAQVVTRSGSNRFHGGLFEFLANDSMNANTFENNSREVTKPPFRRNQFGYSVGGPIARSKTFFSSLLEFSRLCYSTVEPLTLPSSSFVANLPEDSLSRRLLTGFPPLPTTPKAENANIGFTRYQATDRIDSVFASGRVDHHFTNAKDRLRLRYTLASTEEFISGPGGSSPGYISLQPTDHFRGHNGLLGWTHSFDASQINDLRIGWSRERVELPRPQPDVPFLQSGDGAFLPGNKRLLDRRENNNVIQVSDNFLVRRGRSALTVGFEYRRNLSNGIRLGLEREALGGTLFFPHGIYVFENLVAFGEGLPFEFLVSVDRFLPDHLPDLNRRYRSNDYAVFVQNDLKLSRRFSLNLGLRHEYFGVPHNTERSQDLNFYFGPGLTIEERLANGILRFTEQNPGDLKGLLYRRDWLNLAPSIGVAWDPFGRSRTVVRAGYAVALDRLFDTARDPRSNNQQLTGCFLSCPPAFLIPSERMLPLLGTNRVLFREVVQLDENLRTPYAQNWYIGLQQTVTPNFLVEMGHAGSVGRKLISRDVINRSIEGLPGPNAEIGEDTFLSNAGSSNYVALELGLRRRFSRGLQYQVSYTYSHAIDNQSDILEGVRTGPGEGDVALATFTRQFDPRTDRGNANFDQRHNLVLNAIWELPKLRFRTPWLGRIFEGWTASVIGAYRSGFPVTVINSILPDSTTGLQNNRVDFLGSEGQRVNLSASTAVPGGVQWLDPDLFLPATGRVGTLGRGAIRGPGFWNHDFALLRNIGSTEGRIRVQFRAEFFNLFNHANLSAPVSVYSDPFTGSLNPDFGRAYYGLNPTFSRFGDLPLSNPSRTIQFGLRIQF